MRLFGLGKSKTPVVEEKRVDAPDFLTLYSHAERGTLDILYSDSPRSINKTHIPALYTVLVTMDTSEIGTQFGAIFKRIRDWIVKQEFDITHQSRALQVTLIQGASHGCAYFDHCELNFNAWYDANKAEIEDKERTDQKLLGKIIGVKKALERHANIFSAMTMGNGFNPATQISWEKRPR